MLKPYRTIQDVLASRWVLSPPAERHQKTDRVLRSTKLESSIYRDLRAEDAAMDEIEQDAGKKLKSFPALSQDVFQSSTPLCPDVMRKHLFPWRHANLTRRSWST